MLNQLNAEAKREEGKDMEETARKERLAGQRVIPVLLDFCPLSEARKQAN